MSQKIKTGAVSDFQIARSLKFTIPAKPFPREGFVVRHGKNFTAYYNECAHISLPLDWDDNDFFGLDGKSLVCKNHGAEFRPEDGVCITGPCKGATLKKIDITVEDGIVYALIPA